MYVNTVKILKWYLSMVYTLSMTKYISKEPTKGYVLKLPADIHKKLVALAIKERRSLGEQIIYMLEQSLAKSA